MGAPPLHGLRVLDLSHNLAGPLAAMHLGDLGAEVTRIERPGGDDWRSHEPLPGHPGRGRHEMQINRNKRAVCLDLADRRARPLLDALIARADVLVTNMRRGVPERLGFGWERARGLNPRLVYCGLSAFGGPGPLEGRPGYDLNAQALGGFIPPGFTPPGEEPRPSPVPVNDTAGALLALSGVLAALIARAASGRGQRVDASLLGSAVALNAHALVRIEGLPEGGRRTFSRALHRPFRTADGWIAVAVYTERTARAFCAAIGLAGLLERPPWDDRGARHARQDELAALIAPRMATRTSAEWEAALTAADVPASPLRERDDLLDDPQVREGGLLARAEDPQLGPVTMVAPVLRLSETPGEVRFPGRPLGADTRAVLAEIGRTTAEIDALIDAGVAFAAGPDP